MTPNSVLLVQTFGALEIKKPLKILTIFLAATSASPAYASDFTSLIIFFYGLVIVVFLAVYIPLYKWTSSMLDNWPRQMIRILGFSIFWAPFPMDGYYNWWPACAVIFAHDYLHKAAISVVVMSAILIVLARIPPIEYIDRDA